MRDAVRLKLVVSYDGTPFGGWQKQARGKTIQGEIEKALFQICGKRIAVVGAGRTDAGVHALAQCAHANIPNKKYTAARWQSALNGILPPTIRILRVRFVAEKFHARFSARGKVYRYRIVNAPVMPPLENGRACHISARLNAKILEQAAGLFVGRHDFSSFAANRGKPEENTIRVIERALVRQRGRLLEIEFTGNGFLYKMVRLMVGAMIDCACGKMPPDSIARRLARPQPNAARLSVPAAGLYLVRVLY